MLISEHSWFVVLTFVMYHCITKGIKGNYQTSISFMISSMLLLQHLLLLSPILLLPHGWTTRILFLPHHQHEDLLCFHSRESRWKEFNILPTNTNKPFEKKNQMYTPHAIRLYNGSSRQFAFSSSYHLRLVGSKDFSPLPKR